MQPESYLFEFRDCGNRYAVAVRADTFEEARAQFQQLGVRDRRARVVATLDAGEADAVADLARRVSGTLRRFRRAAGFAELR